MTSQSQGNDHKLQFRFTMIKQASILACFTDESNVSIIHCFTYVFSDSTSLSLIGEIWEEIVFESEE